MTREETLKIIMTMQATYPNYKIEDKKLTLNVWFEMLQEYSYQQVAAALKAYIMSDKNGFAPSIGQLVDKMKFISEPQELNDMQAWSLVSKALRNGLYGFEEEFEKLPDSVREAVGNASNIRHWAESDYETIETVIQSNFIKTYRSVVSKRNEINKLPHDMKRMVEDMNPKPELTQKRNANIQTNYLQCDSEGIPMPESVLQRLKEMFPDY